tara:strand:- start:532 stop:753 length:222 start_codon:yes stop_codon:yes gene_type:complete
MLGIENEDLELLSYAILIPLGLMWSLFVLGIILGGLIVLKSIIFPGPVPSWEDLVKEQENRLRYESLIEENTD